MSENSNIKLEKQVQAHLDDYENWTNKKDWLNTALTLSTRFPNNKEQILLYIDEKRNEEKAKVKVNSIMKRAGMSVQKRTRRGFGKRKSGANANEADCLTGDCGDDKTNPGKSRKGLHSKRRGKKKSSLLAKYSNKRQEDYKTNPPSGKIPTPQTLITNRKNIAKNLQQEIGVDIISDTKTLHKHLSKSKLDPVAYKMRLIALYRIGYPLITGEDLMASSVDELTAMNVKKIEKFYIELVGGELNGQIGFTV